MFTYPTLITSKISTFLQAELSWQLDTVLPVNFILFTNIANLFIAPWVYIDNISII